jgi:hypothetical protein
VQCHFVPLEYPTLVRLASRPALRTLTLGSLSAYQPSQLPPGCFSALEALTVHDTSPRAQFAQEFFAQAAAHRLRTVKMSLSGQDETPVAEWQVLLDRMRRFVQLAHVELRVAVPDTVENAAEMVSMVLAALSPLSALEELHADVNLSMAYPESSSVPATLARWPHLRILDISSQDYFDDARTEISLVGFFHVLLACPHLTDSVATVDCAVLPPNTLVASLAQRRHAFNNWVWVRSVSSAEDLAAVLHAALPHFDASQYIWCQDSKAVGIRVKEHWVKLKRGPHVKEKDGACVAICSE